MSSSSAFGESGAFLAVDLDRDLAVEDHVETRAGETLAEDALANWE